MKKWRCEVCGYVFDGEDAPDFCPKCGAKKEKFAGVEKNAGEIIDRSRFTNSLHMELHSVMHNVLDLCEEGTEDDLDPNCVAIFKKAKKAAIEVMHSIKAELQGHMNKGKWG